MTTSASRPARLDLLRLPAIGPFLRWRHARTTLQAALLLLAALVIYDGWFGPQLAPRNFAGVLPWVHWRGLIVLALLLLGNLFCLACPFMLPRRLAKRLLPAARAWPAALRSKWLAIGLLILFFWAYEAFDLWASPWLTAWVAAAYFAAAFAIDGRFKGAAFCKYVCPIGQFHFVNSLVSPFEVQVRRPAICASCTTKDCISGRYARPFTTHPGGAMSTSPTTDVAPRPIAAQAMPAPASLPSGGRLLQRGCELWLFQPKKRGNLDCTFCLDCVQACPHENVGIIARPLLAEFRSDPRRSSIGRLAERRDLAALVLVLVFGALLNAFGMVPPVYELERWLAQTLGVTSEPLVLALVFAVGLVALPLAAAAGAAWLSRRWSGASGTVIEIATRYSYGLAPLGLGIWLAHYLFHFLTGALAVVPVAQSFLVDIGVPVLGEPQWGLGEIVPADWSNRIELLLLQVGVLASIAATWLIARRYHPAPQARRAVLPWAGLALLLFAIGLWLLSLPMEMRGTFLAG